MKKILVSLAVLFLASCATLTPEEKERAAAQKVAEERLNNVLFDRAMKALEEKDFVLEAERVQFKRGHVEYVTSNTNFISVKGNEATVQLALNGLFAGPNGMGGITVDGYVSNFEMKTDKKGNVNCSFAVQGTGVSAQIFFRMVAGSNECTATVSPNFSSNRVSFDGKLLPTANSNVFKGLSR